MKKKIFLLTTIICILTTINVYPYKQNIKKTIVQTNQYLTSAKDAGFESEELYRCVLDTLGKDRTSATDEELSKITEVICRNQKIASTKGIEKLTSLRYLNLYQNNVSTMDLSKNTNLVMLNMTFNKLTNIDLSKNTNLQQLYLNGNQITNIDLTNNSKLIDLNVYNNKLTSINVSNLTELKFLLLSLNKITTIDLSKNTKLEHVYLSGNGLTSLTLPTTANNLSRLDLNKNNLGNNINVSKYPNLNYLIVSANNMSNLDVSKNKNLEYLYASSNNITNIDLTNNTKLIDLDLYSNKISNISLSNLPNLKYINLSLNNLTSLDLSNQKNLNALYASSNKLDNLPLNNQENLTEINAVFNKFSDYTLKNKNKIKYMAIDDNWLEKINLNEYSALERLGLGTYKIIPTYGTSFNVDTINNYISQDIKMNNYKLYHDFGLIDNNRTCAYEIKNEIEGTSGTEITKVNVCDNKEYKDKTINGKPGDTFKFLVHADKVESVKGVSGIAIEYNGYFEIKMITLTSNKYFINENDSTIEVNGDSDQEILNNVKVSWDGANVTINGDKLQITYDNEIIKEFSLKRLTNPVTGSLSLYIIITIAIVTTALIILSKRNTKNNSI